MHAAPVPSQHRQLMLADSRCLGSHSMLSIRNSFPNLTLTPENCEIEPTPVQRCIVDQLLR